MERQDAGVDAEQRVLAQHLDVPVLKVESVVVGYDRGVDERLFIRSIFDREVGQSGDAGGWRPSDRRSRNRVCLRGGGEFECRRLWNSRFEIFVWKSQRCGNGSCSGVVLVCISRSWLPSYEYRWGREALPPTLP